MEHHSKHQTRHDDGKFRERRLPHKNLTIDPRKPQQAQPIEPLDPLVTNEENPE